MYVATYVFPVLIPSLINCTLKERTCYWLCWLWNQGYNNSVLHIRSVTMSGRKFYMEMFRFGTYVFIPIGMFYFFNLPEFYDEQVRYALVSTLSMWSVKSFCLRQFLIDFVYFQWFRISLFYHSRPNLFRMYPTEGVHTVRFVGIHLSIYLFLLVMYDENHSPFQILQWNFWNRIFLTQGKPIEHCWKSWKWSAKQRRFRVAHKLQRLE